MGDSRGGFGTKLHLLVDGRGTPLAVDLSPGQTHDSMRREPLIQQVLDDRPDVVSMQLAGDKGYTYTRIRDSLDSHHIDAVIPKRKDQLRGEDDDDLDCETYRKRNVVERCIGKLKEYRALATRFDKLAMTFLGTIHLAIIRLYLRILDPSDSA